MGINFFLKDAGLSFGGFDPLMDVFLSFEQVFQFTFFSHVQSFLTGPILGSVEEIVMYFDLLLGLGLQNVYCFNCFLKVVLSPCVKCQAATFLPVHPLHSHSTSVLESGLSLVSCVCRNILKAILPHALVNRIGDCLEESDLPFGKRTPSQKYSP